MTREKTLSLLILFGLLLNQQCAYNDITKDTIDCSESNLAIVANTTNTTIQCVTINNEINLVASGGTPPYQFSIDNSKFQTANRFIVTEPRTYVVRVKDSNDCIASADVVVYALESSLTIQAEVMQSDPCAANNGTINVSAAGGKLPYRFNIGGGDYQEHGLFTNLSAGSYLLNVKDSVDCLTSLEVLVQEKESGLLATAETTIDDQCFADNGAITVMAVGGKAPYRYKLDEGDYKTSPQFASVRNGVHRIIVSDVDDAQ